MITGRPEHESATLQFTGRERILLRGGGKYGRVDVREEPAVARARRAREAAGDLGPVLLERRPAFLKRLLVSLFLLPLGLHLAVAGGALGLSALGPPGRDPATDVPGWVAILLLGCGVSFALGA